MRLTGRRMFVRMLAATCALVLGSDRAIAQTNTTPSHLDVSHLRFDPDDAATAPQIRPAPPATPTKTTHHVLAWTVEVHGGYVGSWAPVGGFGVVPAGGLDFVTASDSVSPSASSWFFGRGAAWLNQYAKPVSSTLQVSTLDTTLTSASVVRKRGPAGGVRVTREINQRLDVEVVVDRAETQLVAAPGVLDALQKTNTSFSTVWQRVLQGFPESAVTSVLGGTDRFGQRTLATAALDYFVSFGRVTPYLSAGAGVAANTGSLEATLTGDVQFKLNTFAEHQTDNLDVVFGERRYEPVVVFGAGLVGQLTKRIGWRVDLRDYLIASGLRTTVSASPGIVSGSGVTDLINPAELAIEFNPGSTTASTVGLPLTNVTTFTGTGWHKQFAATVGAFLRF